MLKETKKPFKQMLPPAIKSIDAEKIDNCITHVLRLYGIE